MVTRCLDPDVLTKALDPYDYVMGKSNEEWLKTPGNLAYTMGDDLGLATFDYPGLYAVHWFFKSKGLEAVKVCLTMLDEIFTTHGAHVVRGVTPIENKPARRLAKYVGCETVSIEDYPDGRYEIMLLSRDRFYQFKEKINGSRSKRR
jgi:hypothetical protein